MRFSIKSTAIVFVLGVVVTSQAAKPLPKQSRIGYVYPAGGQQGTSFTAMLGGQYL